MTAATGPGTAPDFSANRMSPMARRAAWGGIVGLFIDSFDVYLPVVVLPAAMSYFTPPSMSPATAVTISTLLFTISLLGRPLGGLIFGNLADRIGRKRVTLISAGGFNLCTLLLGLLPGYATWGVSVLVIFAVLRLVDGIFLGGGYSAPIPLALEQAPPRLRGLVGGLIAAAAGAATLVVSVIQIVALSRMSKSAFLAWGWRLPFFFAVAMGILYMIWYLRVDEGKEEYWAQRRRQRRQPIRELLASRSRRQVVVQVFLVSTGYWFAAQMTVSLLPVLVAGPLHQSAAHVTILTLCAGAGSLIAMPLAGMLGQRFGRKRVLVWTSWAIVGVSMPLFFLMDFFAGANMSFWAVFVPGLFTQVITACCLGVLFCYFNERFPLRVRSTGYSIGYTFGLILPGLYSFWLLGLQGLMPYQYGPLVLMTLGGILMYFGLRPQPETNTTEAMDPVTVASTGDVAPETVQ
jgi:MFS family permease